MSAGGPSRDRSTSPATSVRASRTGSTGHPFLVSCPEQPAQRGPAAGQPALDRPNCDARLAGDLLEGQPARSCRPRARRCAAGIRASAARTASAVATSGSSTDSARATRAAPTGRAAAAAPADRGPPGDRPHPGLGVVQLGRPAPPHPGLRVRLLEDVLGLLAVRRHRGQLPEQPARGDQVELVERGSVHHRSPPLVVPPRLTHADARGAVPPILRQSRVRLSRRVRSAGRGGWWSCGWRGPAGRPAGSGGSTSARTGASRP